MASAYPNGNRGFQMFGGTPCCSEGQGSSTLGQKASVNAARNPAAGMPAGMGTRKSEGYSPNTSVQAPGASSSGVRVRIPAQEPTLMSSAITSMTNAVQE